MTTCKNADLFRKDTMDDKYEVVISGIGGKFPESDTVDEFHKNLLDKVNMVTIDDRLWTPGDAGAPVGTGKVNNTNKFDRIFFGIHRRLAETLDPLIQQALERAYEAIIDAGINPMELSGTNTGVLMGATVSESEFVTIFDVRKEGFGILGHNKSMMANRISYFLNLKGPSFTIDSTWTGGMETLHMAQQMITDGHINSAIVGIMNLLSHPLVSLQFFGMGKLNFDSGTKSFSADANGYNRAEASVVLFLQRAEDAKRCYAKLINTRIMNYGDRTSTFLQCSKPSLSNLLRTAYKDCGIDPSDIAYLEAEGDGCKSVDTVELNTVTEVLCSKRTTPLYVGSVKSNIGHSEGASSFVSLVKALIVLDSGIIPPNLNYSSPNPDVPGLLSNKLKVVTEPVPLSGDLVGVNSFGLVGTYAHTILKQNARIKQSTSDDNIPRLVLLSGRSNEGLESRIAKAEGMKLNLEFVRLLHNAFHINIEGHLYRGYTILPVLETPEREIKLKSGMKKPVWFVFSGMGSQWTGMGTQLMQLPVFASTIKKCHKALEPKGIDLINIITNPDEIIFENILNSFVGIAAIQVALVDILRAVGITPDGIVGHSVGELGCAYADDCITAEQMVLCAYARGRASIEADLISGKMAAIGKGYSQIKDDLPSSIQVACHNASDSCTLSGPTDDMEKYINSLQEKGVFARLVNVSNIAYHSKYIAPAAPALLTYLKEVIPEPKQRSERWISSSIPESEWNSELAKTSSAEYLTNNLLSAVLFEEATMKIPNDAILIEIAPHGLLQAILRRSMGKTCLNVPLTNRSSKDGLRFLLTALGKLYLEGLQLDIAQIYLPVEFPVSRGTPSLQPFVDWDHTEEWNHISSKTLIAKPGERTITISLNDVMYQMYKSHKLLGHIILPPSAILVYAMEILMVIKKEATFSPIVFENVKFFSDIVIPAKSKIQLHILMSQGSGAFEVCIDKKVVASGKVYTPAKIDDEFIPRKLHCVPPQPTDSQMFRRDIYNMFDSLGYFHGDIFQGIQCVNVGSQGLNGTVEWKNDWILFLDAVLKMSMLTALNIRNTLETPSEILRLVIDPTKLGTNKCTVHMVYSELTKTVHCKEAGIRLVKMATRKPTLQPLYKTTLGMQQYKFITYKNNGIKNRRQFLNVCLQTAIENICEGNKRKVNIVKLTSQGPVMELYTTIQAITENHPDFVQKTIFGTADALYNAHISNRQSGYSHLILSDSGNAQEAVSLLRNKQNDFLLAQLQNSDKMLLDGVNIIFEQSFGSEKILLCKKKADIDKYVTVYVSNDDWQTELIIKLKYLGNESGNGVLYLVVYANHMLRIQSFINEINNIVDTQIVRFIFIMDKNTSEFSPALPLYTEQLALDMKVNMLRPSGWGSYKRLDVTNDISEFCTTNNGPVLLLNKLKCEGVSIKCLGMNLADISVDSSENLSEIEAVDYVGVDLRTGEHVMGLAQIQISQTELRVDPVLHWPVPLDWTMEDAATVPLCYSVVYYGLIMKAHLENGNHILIHTGYTLVGQAAIRIALSVGAIVYTTCYTDEQRAFIQKLFPQIPDSHIQSCENTGFEFHFMKLRNGKGFDCIVNTLSGEKMQATVRCLGPFGYLLLFGQHDFRKNTILGTFVFLKPSSASGCNTVNLFSCSEWMKQEIRRGVTEGIRTGTFKPFKRDIIYGLNSTQELLQYLRKSQNNTQIDKKFVYSMEEIHIPQTKGNERNKNVCHPDKSYVIVGGKYGLWIELLEWLVVRGARNVFVAACKKAMTNESLQRFSTLLLQYNSAKVQFVSEKRLETRYETSSFLRKANETGLIESIFIIKHNEHSTVLANLDWVSRHLPFLHSANFVCLLSDCCNICETRRLDGFPATLITTEEPVLNAERIIQNLDTLLTIENRGTSVCFVTEHLIEENETLTNYEQELPKDLNELINTFHNIARDAFFVEVTTRSPRYKHTKDVSPVFIIPSLKSGHLNKLISSLVYPCFTAKLPYHFTSLEDVAKMLFQSLKRDFPDLGMYTFIGVSWSGALALLLAQLLEADNKQVTLILLDAAPDPVQNWVKTLIDDLDSRLIAKYFTLSQQAYWKISSLEDLEEKVNIATAELDRQSAYKSKIAFTALRNKLQAIMKLVPPSEDSKIKGLVHLYRPKGSSDTDNCNLLQFCKTSILIRISEHSQLQDILDDRNTIININSECMFSFPDSVNNGPAVLYMTNKEMLDTLQVPFATLV